MSIARTARLLEASAPTQFSTWGPPVGADEYRTRNVRSMRTRIWQAKQDRDQARREGDHKLADAIQTCIEGWQDTLRGLGL